MRNPYNPYKTFSDEMRLVDLRLENEPRLVRVDESVKLF